ncbi:MAG: anthranilate synthase component I [Planctomycetota bacterium]
MSLTPNFNTFQALAAQHPDKLIPVTRCFLADGLTPVSAYRRMPSSSYAFLLESVERGERIGRYSFVGSGPEIIFRGSVLPEPHYTIERPNGSITQHTSDPERTAGVPPAPPRPNGVVTQHTGDPLVALAQYLADHQAIRGVSGVIAPPFAGGAVGYLGYDVIRLIEPRLAGRAPANAGVPDVPEMLVPIYRTIIAFDHVLNTVTVVHHADPSRVGGAQAAYRVAINAIESVVQSLRQPIVEPLDELASVKTQSEVAPRSNFERGEFMRAVEKAKQYITAGDIIQVVLSQRLSCETTARPFEVYRSLRAINPSPYMFYLRFGPLHLVGSSPEVMVRVEDGLITVRPIAGTRPRGKDAAEDAHLARELLDDPKERAEHVMLLDLGRNDVGRVADYGSVRVDEQMTVENYSHVMHIVSNVSGRMRADLNAFEVFRSCMPAGTVSGAPKIRAMEIIDELEPDRRGAYAGAVGVMDFLGNLNTAIAIRTVVMQEHGVTLTAHVQAGAGIVADSVPEREYEETLNKACALLWAISAAEARNSEP